MSTDVIDIAPETNQPTETPDDYQAWIRHRIKGDVEKTHSKTVDLALWILGRRILREVKALSRQPAGESSAALARCAQALRSIRSSGMPPQDGRLEEGTVARSRSRAARTTLQPLAALPSGPVLPSPDPAPADDAAQAPDMP